MKRAKIIAAVLLIALAAWHFRFEIMQRLVGKEPAVVLIEGLDDGSRRDLIGVLFCSPNATTFMVISRDGYVNGRKLNGLYKSDPAAFRAYISHLIGHSIDAEVRVPFSKLSTFLRGAFPDGLELPKIDYRLKYADHRASPPFAYDIPASDKPVVLSADDLQWYLRDRKSDPLRRGEKARVERWSTFLKSALRNISGSQGLTRIPNIVASARRVFHTDLTTAQGIRIALAVARGEKLNVTYAPMTPFREGKAWFARLDEDAIRERSKLILSGICPPENTAIWVLNGTRRCGLARSTAQHLGRVLGVPCQAGNAPSVSTDRTSVSYNRDSLRALSQYVCDSTGACSTRLDTDKAPFPLIVVTIGADFREERR